LEHKANIQRQAEQVNTYFLGKKYIMIFSQIAFCSQLTA